MNPELPPIPPKRYFTIGEVSELCAVKPYVLRYWEQEFTQLRPMKRRGNRRYYQHHEVLLVRRIRELLYEKRFTISGARDRLAESQLHGGGAGGFEVPLEANGQGPGAAIIESSTLGFANDGNLNAAVLASGAGGATGLPALDFDLRRELLAIRRFLSE